MRQGDHPDALRQLNAAEQIASSPGVDPNLALRVDAWRAELAYFQGRYSDADEITARLLPSLERMGDMQYVAFALRIRIATGLARVDYEAVQALADRAVRAARLSGDPYTLVQILNVLGAFYFDRATSKSRAPHARAHLSSLDPEDTAPMEEDAHSALHFFEQARAVAKAANYEFAAWYVSGNIERLEIIVGSADRAVRAIRKRLGILQARGARYDEIVTRSNLAWGLRTLGRHREALHELDVALAMARSTGTLNVLLEFLEYDRSIVLDALGDAPGARASYRRYVQLAGGPDCSVRTLIGESDPAAKHRLLEPFFLKRADRFVHDHLGEPFTVEQLARHCGVSWRTLDKAFTDFRGITPVAHVRNARLDYAFQLLNDQELSVANVAQRSGFRSPTNFAVEFRKRFSMTPSHAKHRRRAEHP
jgi:AraC-like DNA-binding protein/tetratricopeptide (TPR) repeat protein